ncbi:MAG: PAS domain S-box protein [Bacteroidota bacterium]
MKKIQISISNNLCINNLIIDGTDEFIFDIKGESFFYYFTPLTFIPAKDNFLFLKGLIVNQFAGELFHFKSGNTECFVNLFFDEKKGGDFIINGFKNDSIELNSSLKKFDSNQNLYDNNFDLFPLKLHTCSITLNGFKTFSSYSKFFPEHLKIKKVSDIYSFLDEESILVFKSKIELLTKKNIPLDIVYKLKKSNNESIWYRTILRSIPEMNCFYGGTIQIEKKAVDDYHNRIINKVFQKTEQFAKSGYWYFDLISNSVLISNSLKIILNTIHARLPYNDFLKLFLNETNTNYFKSIFKNCTTNGADFELELSYNNVTSVDNWFKIAGSADIVNNNIIGVYGTIADITDEKNHALLLRETQKQFETILKHNLQGVLLLDSEGIIVSFNEIMQYNSKNTFGFDIAKGEKFENYFSGDLKESFVTKFSFCLSGLNQNSIRQFTDKLGATIFVKIDYVPIFNSKKAIENVLLLLTDITDFKTKELELQELSIVASSISSGVYIVDSNHKIKWINKAYQNLIDTESENVIGKKPFILNASYVNKKLVNEIENALASNNFYRGELNIKRKNNSNYWAMVNITPIVDEQNKLLQYIVIEDDISDKKNAEAYKKFIENQKNLREIREQKIRTLSVLSGQETERMKFSKDLHEGIGQTLTATKFALASIKKYSEEKSFQEKIASIDTNLKEVIDRIRVISKDLSPSSLYDFGLEAAIEELIAKHKKESTSIDFRFTSNLNKVRLGIVYEVELFRMVAEIILNAVSHSKCDSILIDISYNDNAISISVADNGVGFEKSKINFKTKGLKNINERARLIRAEVNNITRPGKGSVFLVDLNFNKE